jgi:hypothetical protein
MPPARLFLVVVAVLAAVALPGCAALEVDTDDPTEATTPLAPTTTDAPTTIDRSPERYALGETVELDGDDATVAVTVVDYQFVDAYDTESASGGTETVGAPAGQQFLFVKVTVEHVDGAATATPAAAVRPSNDSVDVSDSIPASTDDGIYRSVRELPAGETATGWLAVQVDADVTPSDVTVAFSLDILVTSDEFQWTLVDDED